jgi:hypothetical protein
MPEHQRPLKVFLSYASQDRPIVRELSRRLVGEGWIETWLDEKSLLPGEDWRLKIEEAVDDADIVIICLSNNSVSKDGYVQKELRYAREIALEKPEETIFLIPLRLDDCIVPRGLRFYQWADYFGEKKEDAYSTLLEALKKRHKQKLHKGTKRGEFLIALKSISAKFLPLLRIIGILGIITALLWGGAWALPKFVSMLPMPEGSSTQSSTLEVASTKSPTVSAQVTNPTSTPTKTRIPAATAQIPWATLTAPPRPTSISDITATNLCGQNVYVFKTASVDEPIGDAYIAPNATFDLTGVLETGWYPRSGSMAFGFFLETTGPFNSTYTDPGWIFLLYDDHPCVKFTKGNNTLVLNIQERRFEIAPTATATP